MMDPNKIVDALKQRTGQMPLGAEERVWRRLQQPSAPQRSPFRLVLAGVAALLLGALGLTAAHRFSQPYVWRGDGFAVWAPAGTTVDSHAHEVRVSSGTAFVSCWSKPLTLEAAGHQVRADAAVFAVSVAGDAVTVAVEQGTVVVDSEWVSAPASWPVVGHAPQHLSFGAVHELEPADAIAQRNFRLAEHSLDQGHAAEAVKLFDEVGSSSDLRAEAASVRSAQIALWQLKQPQDALNRLAAAQQKFPHGDLAQEMALSRVEALVTLQRWPEAGSEARALLRRFPNSERKVDMTLISASSHWRAGEAADACRELKDVSSDGVPTTLADLAAQLQKSCRKDSSNTP
jgi:hypothetical protein